MLLVGIGGLVLLGVTINYILKRWQVIDILLYIFAIVSVFALGKFTLSVVRGDI